MLMGWMDGGSRRLKTVLWCPPPPLILSRWLAGVVLLGLTAPGLRRVAESGHQWMEGYCLGTGRAADRVGRATPALSGT